MPHAQERHEQKDATNGGKFHPAGQRRTFMGEKMPFQVAENVSFQGLAVRWLRRGENPPLKRR